LKNLCIFYQQAGRLEQLDHFQKISIFLDQWVGRLKQFDHFQKIFVFFTNGHIAWNN
jgi:hypothetical protein